MDLTCPICLNVFFKPIRLPCEHVVCQNCLELSLDISNLTCPICRFRLSNWKRRLKDTSVCIDKVRDRKIQRLFPLYYSNRSAGMDVSLDGCEMSLYNSISESDNTRRPTDTPGSVALEFEASLQRIRNNKKAYESLQEEASLALARQLLLETGGDEDSLDCYTSEEKENLRLADGTNFSTTKPAVSHVATHTSLRNKKSHKPFPQQKIKDLTAYFPPTQSTPESSKVSHSHFSCTSVRATSDSVSDPTERCYSGDFAKTLPVQTGKPHAFNLSEHLSGFYHQPNAFPKNTGAIRPKRSAQRRIRSKK
uniref:RING-type E3 ubiquitin transferase n=1 Tax=Schistocephalus solidus TaxID=70667 RepID=A0A0X3PP97_SCHSO